jgi:hypothetical protein
MHNIINHDSRNNKVKISKNIKSKLKTHFGSNKEKALREQKTAG